MMDGSDRSDDGQIVSVASVQPRTYTHYTILWLAHAGTCLFSFDSVGRTGLCGLVKRAFFMYIDGWMDGSMDG